MLTVETLKNININVFEEFFRNHDVKRRTVRVIADSTPDKYEKILNLINEELESGDSFSEIQLDELLFEQLYYVNNNYHYLYSFDSFFANKTTPYEDAKQHLSNHPTLQPILLPSASLSDGSGIEIYTVRLEQNEESCVKSLHILLKISIQELKYGPTNIFAGVLIDIDTGHLLLKFNLHQFEEIDKEPLVIVRDIINFLNSDRIGDPVKQLNLNIISLNEQTPKNAIYYMFEEMSKEAEEMLDNKVTEEQEEKIKVFLKDDLGLTTITDDYIEQIKAVIFQDISNSIRPSAFREGWVFRFHYREGDHTRATSKQEDRGPVYTSKTFWQLKELIYKEKEMMEAGFHWFLPNDQDVETNDTDAQSNNTDIQQFIDVKLSALNDTMTIHHYAKTKQKRKEKEEFVLRKIVGNLS